MVEKIFNAIENEFGIPKKDILSKTKTKHISEARGILYYMLHYDAKLSSAKVGEICNRQARSIKKSISTFKFLIENQERYITLHEKLLRQL